MKIGILSDTHGLLRPEALAALAGVDHILHAGDVGSDTLLETLRSIAPLNAIRGNIDREGLCGALPPTEALELGGKLFYLVHSIRDLDINPRSAQVDVVVSGHSHTPSEEMHGSVLYINPGSAGKRRFHLPITLVLADLVNGEMETRLIDLDPKG